MAQTILDYVEISSLNNSFLKGEKKILVVNFKEIKGKLTKGVLGVDFQSVLKFSANPP